ncbi:hypothetical protein ACFWO0_38550, partial [Streptomyces sp. NPDC058461]
MTRRPPRQGRRGARRGTARRTHGTFPAYLARRLEARMTTTTSQTPGPDGPSRPARLIQNEATT